MVRFLQGLHLVVFSQTPAKNGRLSQPQRDPGDNAEDYWKEPRIANAQMRPHSPRQDRPSPIGRHQAATSSRGISMDASQVKQFGAENAIPGNQMACLILSRVFNPPAHPHPLVTNQSDFWRIEFPATFVALFRHPLA